MRYREFVPRPPEKQALSMLEQIINELFGTQEFTFYSLFRKQQIKNIYPTKDQLRTAIGKLINSNKLEQISAGKLKLKS